MAPGHCRHNMWLSESEESEVREEPGGGVDDGAGGLKCFGGFGGASPFGWVKRIFQLVAPAAQSAECPQAGAELGADRFFDGIVPARGSGAQPLLGQQGDAGLPGRIIDKD